MKTLTVREAREGLSHPEDMFAHTDEVLVVRHGEPVARILPPAPPRRVRSLAAFRTRQTVQSVPSEDIVAADREERAY